jgi:hypothetical protein
MEYRECGIGSGDVKMRNNERVLVIGIDGWTFVNSWIPESLLDKTIGVELK